MPSSPTADRILGHIVPRGKLPASLAHTAAKLPARPHLLRLFMSIDTYSICPCGSGKKIKFCKCKDSVHELDRVLKMIDGGQLVPALDRLSAILEEHPDAAWALAIRGRLFMDLREYTSLEENAERFRRLQPSNPLALTQSAAAALFRQDLSAATELILEALTESGQTVDSFVLDVASLLSYALAGNGILLTSRVYATLALVSTGYEDSRMAANVLQQINGDPSVNQLAKAVPNLIPPPESADWVERYDEAALLLSNNKVALAQTKFESLQRSAPLQPAVLSGLLNCAIWRGDHVAQSELLVKLSQCEELDFDERARFLALAQIASPDADGMTVEHTELMADVDSIDEYQMALIANPRFEELPADALESVKREGDVAPRSAFQILDRAVLDEGETLTADNIPVGLAALFLFGRETDRSARLQVLGLPVAKRPQVQELLDEVAPNVNWTEGEKGQLPLAMIATPQIGGIRPEHQKDLDAVVKELIRQRVPETLSTTPVKLLGDVSLKDAASDDSKKLQRAAMVRFIEGEDSLVARDEELINRLCELGNLPQVERKKITGDELEEIPGSDLDRIDPSGLDPENLIYLIQRAQQISATSIGRRASIALLEADTESVDDGRFIGAKIIAYSFLMQRATESDEAVDYLDKAKVYAEEHKLSDASLLLAELGLRLRRQEIDLFQNTVQAIVQKHSDNPEVMGRLQQILAQLGLINPDGTPRQAPGMGPASQDPAGGGLWTPDGDSGGSAPASPAGGEASGGGKLWVPGMD
ncbi:tetratricopeptide repeat protein [Rhodopirellula islandica]|uniref:tetratricopeptide repeat protein n=1 Tax=Rhodopirellula islandica TaxID=595434 RepID=UPI00064AEB85|nr:protein disulfide-isomerase [Rhodopirellula islandica]